MSFKGQRWFQCAAFWLFLIIRQSLELSKQTLTLSKDKNKWNQPITPPKHFLLHKLESQEFGKKEYFLKRSFLLTPLVDLSLYGSGQAQVFEVLCSWQVVPIKLRLIHGGEVLLIVWVVQATLIVTKTRPGEGGAGEGGLCCVQVLGSLRYAFEGFKVLSFCLLNIAPNRRGQTEAGWPRILVVWIHNVWQSSFTLVHIF